MRYFSQGNDHWEGEVTGLYDSFVRQTVWYNKSVVSSRVSRFIFIWIFLIGKQ